jgi:hypothetical protein
MKAVLIGTAAYRANYQDIDLICDQEFADQLRGCEQMQGTKGTVYYVHGEFEATVPNPGNSYDLILQNRTTYCKRFRCIDIPGAKNVEVDVAYIPTLLALKKAHLILPRKWKHHMFEYSKLKDVWFESDKVMFLPKEHHSDAILKLYRLHRKECLKIAKAHPVLKNKKDEFFGSTNAEAEKEYELFDHDTIHVAIALEGGVPAYTHMLGDDEEVWCDRSKWNAMSGERKFNCVREEAAILALERSIIPSLYLGKAFKGEKWAYEMALFKICTTITSGWFRDYCIERYWEAVDERPDYVNSFFEGLKSGQITVVNEEVVCGAR